MIKTNIKMRVTPEQSAKVQEICFKNGINWGFLDDIVRYEEEPYIFIEKENRLSWLSKYQNDNFIRAREEEINAELFIRTNGTCIEKERWKMKHNDKMESLKDWEDTTVNKDFKYPMWFKSKKWDFIVKFTDLIHGVVLKGTNPQIDKDFSCSLWTAHTDTTIWEQVENPDLVTDINNNKAKNPNSKHYELWENFEAIDVIKLALTDEEYKGFLKGNILKYRLRAGKKNIENDNIIKDINKSIDYQRELNK